MERFFSDIRTAGGFLRILWVIN